MRELGWIGCFLILVFSEARAQTAQFAYRVSFTNKQGSPAPALSPRSLQRRAAQGITVDSTDRPVSPAYLDSARTLTGGVLHNTSRWLNHCVILLKDSANIHALEGKPYVRSIDYVGYFANGLHQRPAGSQQPSSGQLSVPFKAGQLKTTGTAAFYGNSYPQTSMVNGDYLHDLGYMGQGKLIAVLDAGFAESNLHYGFDSLRQRGGIVDTYNFLINDTDVYRYTVHGTEAFSTMAGYIPGTYVGAAPKADYALYLTDDNNFTDAVYELDNFLAGMERADSIGADLISSSLGYNEFTSPNYFLYPKPELDGHTTIVAQGVNMAVAKGIFVVTSAGNEGGNSWNFLLTPGDADSALTVGAVSADRTPASFSGPGPNALGRIKPDVCGKGNPAAVFAGNHSVINGTGTSWSTPQIAGWTACLWQANSGLKPFAIRTAIIESADHYTNPGAQIGYGIPDFKKAQESLNPIPPDTLRTPALIVSPNPFYSTILVQLAFKDPADVQFLLQDVTGRRLFTHGVKVPTGNQDVRLQLPLHLPTGVYYLKTVIGTKQYLNKLVKG